jgi:hypothetical protein
MDCEQLQSRLDDMLDNTLPEHEYQETQGHLSECVSCQALVAEEQALRTMLRELPVSPPSAGFADRALRVAVERNSRHHHRSGFIKGFAAAMAAGLALWIIVGILPVSKSPYAPAGHENEISIALYQTQNIKLAFNSAIELKDARITIELPNNLALTGYEGRRELTWHTNLTKGDNILTLPVKAQAIAKGRIIAKIEHGSRTKTIEIAIDVKGAGMSMEPFLMDVV